MAKLLISLTFLTACAGQVYSPSSFQYAALDGYDFMIGETKFYVKDNAPVWANLPEVMGKLQKEFNAPSEDFWAVPVEIYPMDTILPNHGEETQAAYYWYDETYNMPCIRIRVYYTNALYSSLSHEFAHRADHFLNPDADRDLHDEGWLSLYNELRAIQGLPPSAAH